MNMTSPMTLALAATTLFATFNRPDLGLLALGRLSLLLLAVLGIALVVVLFRMFVRKSGRSPRTPPPPPDLGSLTVREARRGDLITIRGAGPNYDDLSFKVEKIHRYEFGGERWYELFGPGPEGPVSLEWEDDGSLVISLTPPGRTIRLPDLGVTEKDLIGMDESQSATNTVTYHGIAYRYEESHETGYFEDEREPGEGFYMWSFTAENGKTFLTIEKWEGEAFEAMISDSIAPTDVTVYRP